MRTFVTAASLALALAATTAVPAIARRGAPDPCSLVDTGDAFRLLGWTIDEKHKRPYEVMGATGTMCFLHASQGQIIVTVPEHGIDFVGATPYNDSNAKSLARPVYGLGADVLLYNGTAYVTRYRRSVSIHVVPNDAPASYADVEGFAKVALRHMR